MSSDDMRNRLFLPTYAVVMTSHVAIATRTGLVRQRNEDSGYAGRWLCAVADGMGGHVGGDTASATVIDAVREFDAAPENPGQMTAVLGAAVREANKRIAARVLEEPGLASMGSTLTALFWSGSIVVVANIGDSRAYRLRDGVLTQLTEDHVLSNLVATPMPSEIGEYLVRFLDRRPGWSPDLTLRTAMPGDRYLICSDGLSGVLSADRIREVLGDAESLDQAVETLIQETYAAGAPDNVTVIAVDLPEGLWQERNGNPVIVGAAANLAALT
jgi:serine/threonine protein phosphatase PrpC